MRKITDSFGHLLGEDAVVSLLKGEHKDDPASLDEHLRVCEQCCVLYYAVIDASTQAVMPRRAMLMESIAREISFLGTAGWRVH